MKPFSARIEVSVIVIKKKKNNSKSCDDLKSFETIIKSDENFVVPLNKMFLLTQKCVKNYTEALPSLGR